MKKILQCIVLLLLVNAGHAQTKTVLNVNDFEKAVKDSTVQLLDVRTPGEYKEGFIKGAINADWQNENVFTAAAKKLDKTKPVYLYCLSGVRSGKAADWLSANGFTKTINLEGGIKAWKAADKKVEIK
jgi:rhodanese-related sulfurtransferase